MSLHDIWRGDVMPLSGVAVAIGRNSFDPPAPVVPVFDIHARSLVFHDSGSDVPSSGILQYNGQQSTEGGRLELIPSMSGAQPIVTAVLFDAYEAAGGLSVTTTITPLSLDTERVNTHPLVYVLAGDELQINNAGTYVFEYTASYDIASTTRTSSQTVLRRQAPGAGAFSTVTASLTWGYHRTTAAGEGSCSAKVILDDVVAGELFRLEGIIIAGAASISQLAEGTRLTVRRLA